MSRTSPSVKCRTNDRIRMRSEHRAAISTLRQRYRYVAELITFNVMLLFLFGVSRPRRISSLVLISYVPEANGSGIAIEQVRTYPIRKGKPVWSRKFIRLYHEAHNISWWITSCYMGAFCKTEQDK